MNIPELILGLFGGGVLGQLCMALVNRTANRRQINAQALGGEVAALEQTIRLLRESMEAEVRSHAEERESMRREIRGLNDRISQLNESIIALRGENARLRAVLGGAGTPLAVSE